MPTPLKGSLKRVIRVYGVDVPVHLHIHEGGIEMSVAGTRTKIFGSWPMVVEALRTPSTVPSYLAYKPMALLKHMAAKVKTKREEGDS
jgi:hypothetical protein